VSLEAYSVGEIEWPVSTRHRFALFSPDTDKNSTLRSSDVILYRPPDGTASSQQPANGDQVLALMLPRSTISTRETVGLYWEIYGLDDGEEPEFELSVAPVDSGSVLSAVGRWLRLSSGVSSSFVRYKSAAVTRGEFGPDGEKPYTLQVVLNALKPGMYVLQLSTTVADRKVAVRRGVRID
jgi:hypothetical protein